MTAMLASVNSLQEAKLIQALEIDIIDLKQPAQGALGALSTEQVETIVKTLGNDQPISATIGDLPLSADIVCPAVERMAITGVDYIKIGFFPSNDSSACIQALASYAANHALIAVLFADTNPDFALLNQLKQAGFRGAMLDTINKSQGRLTTIMPMQKITQFVSLCRQLNLTTGLAGSLRLEDIALLQPLAVDYLGFRGALCAGVRTSNLNIDKTRRIQQALQPLSLPLTG